MASWRNCTRFHRDRNTVNSCCTISILKNPQQFAWGWEIRHQTSKNRRILHESACMLAGGCTPKWAQFRRPPPLAVPTVLLSEKYSCTDHVSTIAKHFPYGTSVCSSLTSENFGQNRYRKSSHWDLVCPIQYPIDHVLVCKHACSLVAFLVNSTFLAPSRHPNYFTI